MIRGVLVAELFGEYMTWIDINVSFCDSYSCNSGK